jgi:KDO2-lipid IV(A) lauroyltransferase
MSKLETENETPAPPLPRKKRLERAAGRLGLRLVVGPLRALPLPMARAVGRGVGIFLYTTLRRYRNVAHKNLALVYGAQIDTRARARMARSVFVHFGQVAAEFVKMPQLALPEIDALCEVDGEENLCRALESGQGVLMITGHFGNWEFMSRWLTAHGYPLNVVARRANDPEADRLLTNTRTGGGAQVYNRGNSARAVLQCLRRKEIVGLLPDQNAGDVFVPFLGQRTGTVDGPAIIHLRTGAPLVFCWCVRMPDNRFRITFEPPVVIEPTGDRNADIIRVMTLVNAQLEAQIYQHPTQWLWLHDRWKSSPGVFDRDMIQAAG